MKPEVVLTNPYSGNEGGWRKYRKEIEELFKTRLERSSGKAQGERK